MTKPATIIFEADNDTVPLHAHYQGQTQAQPAYIILNLNTGIGLAIHRIRKKSATPKAGRR